MVVNRVVARIDQQYPASNQIVPILQLMVCTVSIIAGCCLGVNFTSRNDAASLLQNFPPIL